MCKKTISVVMSILMIMSVFAGLEISSVAEDDILNYLTYEINDGEVTITGCDESITGDVVIPDTIKGYPVTTIGTSLFYRCDKIESVVIPATVKKIGDDIFSGCDAIANITVDKNNEYYSSDDHGVLFNKDKSVLICFPENSPLTEYAVPDTVEIIGSSAFAYCKNVNSISIPKSVTTLENKAFWNSDICGDIVLPYNVAKIDWGVFYGCNIESVTITNPNCTIPMGLMYPPIPQKTTIIAYPDSIAEAYANKLGNVFVALEGAPPTEEHTTEEPTTKEPETQAPTTEKPSERPTEKPTESPTTEPTTKEPTIRIPDTKHGLIFEVPETINNGDVFDVILYLYNNGKDTFDGIIDIIYDEEYLSLESFISDGPYHDKQFERNGSDKIFGAFIFDYQEIENKELVKILNITFKAKKYGDADFSTLF